MQIVLYDDEKNCCACGACMNICPKDAISMVSDDKGFVYPNIDPDKCISCGACKKVCAYQNQEVPNTPLQAFAAVNKNQKQLMESASGGVFSAMATSVLQRGGVVFGAALDFVDGHAFPHHVAIETVEELRKVQGSKYVQSEIGTCYQQAQRFLKEGRQVLFSGTPCQIAGLYGYLRKDYDNLVTVDLICHGVPSAEFFDGYIQSLGKKYHKAVTGFSFRDKEKDGWGKNAKIVFIGDSERTIIKNLPGKLSSYLSLFFDGNIFRESCYSCKYAGKKRVGDLTIGDYWGIEKEHPDLLKSGKYDAFKGISCLLVNTEKGRAFCSEMGELLQMDLSAFEKVSNRNGQLKKPLQQPSIRKNILEIYKNGGYAAVEKWFGQKYRKQLVLHTIYNKFPRTLRMKLKKLIKG